MPMQHALLLPAQLLLTEVPLQAAAGMQYPAPAAALHIPAPCTFFRCGGLVRWGWQLYFVGVESCALNLADGPGRMLRLAW